jgi:hypothetical protein
MAPIEPSGIRAQKPFHARHQVGFRSFHNEVKMIWEKAVGVHLPAGLVACGLQRLQKTATVSVVPENILPTITAIHEEVYAAGNLYS